METNRNAATHYHKSQLNLVRERDGAAYWAVALEKTMLSYFEVEPHVRFESHRHESEQMTMVLEGELCFEVGGAVSCVGAGEVFAIPAGIEHAVFTREARARAIDAWSPPPAEYPVTAGCATTCDAGSRPYFESVAEKWDGMRQSFFSESVREAALDIAAVARGERAADIGAGAGFLTEELLRRGLTVVAVDQSPAMLAEIRKRFESSGAVECRAGAAEALPIESASVDHVFANMFLHHVESPPVAIREMARVLRPGGKLVITDLDAHAFEFLRTEQHDRWLGFARDDVRRWYEEAGLRNVRVGDVGSSCCGTSSCGTETAQITIFYAYGEK